MRYYIAVNAKDKSREATKAAFVAALAAELAEGRPLTVEAVAARAGANKALVYRYFGGLPGLIAAYASGESFMASASELLELGGPLEGKSSRERFAACATAAVAALARRPATVQVLLRLPTFDAPTLKALREGRARGIAEIREAFGEPSPDLGFDPDVAFGLLLSGACQMLAAGRSTWLGDERPSSELVAMVSGAIRGMLGVSEWAPPGRPMEG